LAAFPASYQAFPKNPEIQWAHSAIQPMRHFKTSPKSVVSIRLILDQTRKNKLYEKSKGSPPFADIHLIRAQRSGSWYWGAAPDLDVADSSGQNGGSHRYTYFQGPYSNPPYSQDQPRTWSGSRHRRNHFSPPRRL
jgi:hypothetical protein